METNTEQLSIIADGWQHKDTPTFEELSASILQTHQSAQASAIKAVNQMPPISPTASDKLMSMNSFSATLSQKHITSSSVTICKLSFRTLWRRKSRKNKL